MSAQVTEAHLELAKTVIFSRDASGRLLTAPMAAQIIADSEAKACDQLRAEVERLRAACDKFSNDEITQGDWKARAERAEAKLNESRYETVKAAQEGLRECIRAERAESDADSTRERALTLANSLDGAQAELAVERARLRQIALDACRSAKITPIVWYPKRYAIDPNDFGIINEQQVEACAQAIDAAMKEEMK